jgi:flagellar hook assembly protein FlgD
VVVSGISGGALAASISPNPLNPKATLSLSLARAGRVKVDLFDVQGRLMRTLLDGSAAAGYVDVEIDGTDAAGRKLASGIYYVSIVTAEGRMTKPITILK